MKKPKIERIKTRAGYTFEVEHLPPAEKKKSKKPIGRPRMPLTPSQLEKELAALERLWKDGVILDKKVYRRKMDELVARFENGG